MSAQIRRATFWAQVMPTWNSWWPGSLQRITVRKITQRKPKHPEPGCLLVKLTIALPETAFVPRQLEGEVMVEPGQFEQVPPTVTAERLGDGDE